MAADSMAAAAIEAAGGDANAVMQMSDEAKAPIHARVVEAQAAQAKLASLREAAEAKAAAKAKASKAEATAKAAAERAPSGRTVQRRAFSDWDKVKLDDDSDEEEGGPVSVR